MGSWPDGRLGFRGVYGPSDAVIHFVQPSHTVDDFQDTLLAVIIQQWHGQLFVLAKPLVDDLLVVVLPSPLGQSVQERLFVDVDRHHDRYGQIVPVCPAVEQFCLRDSPGEAIQHTSRLAVGPLQPFDDQLLDKGIRYQAARLHVLDRLKTEFGLLPTRVAEQVSRRTMWNTQVLGQSLGLGTLTCTRRAYEDY